MSLTKISFSKARAVQRKLRLLISGPSGAGKTFSALNIVSGLRRDGDTVALIDTEKGSASLYAQITDFDTCDLEDRSPESYIAAIRAAEAAGYTIGVIDSLSHAWEFCVEYHDKMTGNSWTNWGKVHPRFTALMNAIINSPMHWVVTARAKMKYEQGDDKKVTPVGMEPILRPNSEYEFDMFGLINIDHNLEIRKTRFFPFADKIYTRPGAEFGTAIRSFVDGLEAGDKRIVEPKRELNLDLAGHVIETEGSSKSGKTIQWIVDNDYAWIEKVAQSPELLAKLTPSDAEVVIKTFGGGDK